MHPRRLPLTTLPAFPSGLRVRTITPSAVPVVVSVGTFGYAGYLTVLLALRTSWSSSVVSESLVRALQVVDVSLIGIAALGIAALGIAADALVVFTDKSGGARVVPRWLQEETADVLKNRALAMVVLIMAVTFLEGVVQAKSGSRTSNLGSSIAAVIAVIGVHLVANRLKVGGPPPRGPGADWRAAVGDAAVDRRRRLVPRLGVRAAFDGASANATEPPGEQQGESRWK